MSKGLVRPREGKIVAGVCAGVANYFGINVLWVRLFWIFLLISGSLPGILPYVILWIIMPKETAENLKRVE